MTLDEFFGRNNLQPVMHPQPSMQPQFQQPMGTGLTANPFTTAMSGTQSNTLQDYINRMTSMANQSQGGGLINFQPQQYQAGQAGGNPLLGNMPQVQNPLSSFGFGQRSWMNK